jgi:hypothetical protein
VSAQLQRLPRPQTLSQHLVTCPGCAKPSAAHLDIASRSGVARLVRLVCPDGCSLTEADTSAIAAALTGAPDSAADSLPA